MSDTLIIAHRGESFDAPENTLSAINLAWTRNAKSVEIDIHLTKDQHIVVIHDNDTRRVAGKKLVVKNSTLSELRSLKLNSRQNNFGYNEQIPTLLEVLQTVPPHGKLIIEIKSDEKILASLKDVLAQSKLESRQIMMIAFNEKTLAKAKEIMPEYKMLWLLDLDYYWPYRMLYINHKRIIKKAKKHQFDGINVWAGKLLNCSFIEKFHEAGLLVYCWTVDLPETAASLIKCRIDGITTNRAHWLSSQLS